MVSVNMDIISGIPKSVICKKLGISKSTLYNRLKILKNI